MTNLLPLILAIDTSCDDTSVAITQGQVVLANVISSQTQLHKPYGGVFPTIAKQAHKENIDAAIKIALKRASLTIGKIDAFAVTIGPGLAPALEVGIAKAKALAKLDQKLLIAINHTEGHILSVLAQRKSRTGRQGLEQKVKTTARKSTTGVRKTNLSQAKSIHPLPTEKFPALAIVVSGGHSQFILVKNIGDYQILGSTIDDAAGECLDKVGRMLNLGYPAGPVIEEFAKKGNAKKFEFPLPMTTIKNFNLSFSGLKTYASNLIRQLEAAGKLNKQAIYDISASFQRAVFKHIAYKLDKILKAETSLLQSEKYFQEIWLGGGVSANISLRKMIRETIKNYLSSTDKSLLKLEQDREKLMSSQKRKLRLKVPFSKKLCSDNAAMIGIAAFYKYQQAEFVDKIDQLERKPRFLV
ncbi:MAG: tRNA (adenosine(37)-N6)-threonylcarbamoyltransferase complex transferase subunit TsaD [Candidatus Woesebacteria bacterium]|jgi:N6-L-threonylcarbamoyladenine synthase